MSTDELLRYFERELADFRRDCDEYGTRYPKIGTELLLVGGISADPSVERLIQGFALVAARVAKRLDDSYPQFTEALLEVLLPHYLRFFPSCAIVRLDPGPPGAGKRAMVVIPRGTLLESEPVQGVRCKFQTAYELVCSSLRLTQARFERTIMLSSDIRLPPGVGSAIKLTLEWDAAQIHASGRGQTPVRVYINGESTFSATLRDAIFMQARRAYLETAPGQWIELAAIPVRPVGFAEQDALLPYPMNSQHAYRLLSEYFAFPDKFNFFDIELAALAPHLPPDCARLTLCLGLSADLSGADNDPARILAGLDAEKLLLGCVPVVNLFKQAGAPIMLNPETSDYPVLADTKYAGAYEVYSVDSVHMLRKRAAASSLTEFRPLYSMKHAESDYRQGHYWVMRHDAALALQSPGFEKRLSLVDIDVAPLTLEKATLSLNLTCSNRDLPCKIRFGQEGGDLVRLGDATSEPIRFIRRPTRPLRGSHQHGNHWRLISHLSLNHHSLVQEGLAGFREMLLLYDLQHSPISQRQIRGIVGLSHAKTTAWMRQPRGATLVHGTEVRLTLDEEAFVGSGMQLFIQVIDQFLGLYVHLNSFSELVILSNSSGEEIFRCKPRNGSLNLL